MCCTPPLYSNVLPLTSARPFDSTLPFSKFTEKAKLETTTASPCGAMAVHSGELSRVVVMAKSEPARIEIWYYWIMAGECFKTLARVFLVHSLLPSAVLPDGRFVAVDRGGFLRVGSLDNWAAATVIRNREYDRERSVTGVLPCHDGSFVTGASGVTLKILCKDCAHNGVHLAVIGRRLIVGVDYNNNLLVAE